jgi:integrase
MPASVVRLTSTYLESLKPESKPRDVGDPAVRGLLIRVWPWGTKNWLFRYYWKKTRVRISLGNFPDRSLAQARELAIEYRDLLKGGIDPRSSDRAIVIGNRAAGTGGAPQEPRGIEAALFPTEKGVPDEFDALLDSATIELDAHSFGFLLREFYRRHVLPGRKQPGYVRRIIKAELFPVWKDRDARTIKPREVITLLDTVVDRGSRVMANRIASVLSQLFIYGIHRDIVEDSPVKLLGRPGGKEKRRRRALTPTETQAFVQKIDIACRSRKKARTLMVLLLTMQRRSELGLARWTEFDFEKKTWLIPEKHTKKNRAQLVPLTDWAIEELTALRRMSGQSKFVFPSTHPDRAANPKLITRSVARSLHRFKEIGVEAFRPHDLRRTGRTGLARLKVDRDIAKKVLNQLRDDMDETYDVFEYIAEKRAALEAWERYLLDLKATPMEDVTLQPEAASTRHRKQRQRPIHSTGARRVERSDGHPTPEVAVPGTIHRP